MGALYVWCRREEPAPTTKDKTMTTATNTFGLLCDYATAEVIRPATEDERAESREAARLDGGAGVIEIDGVACYVEE